MDETKQQVQHKPWGISTEKLEAYLKHAKTLAPMNYRQECRLSCIISSFFKMSGHHDDIEIKQLEVKEGYGKTVFVVIEVGYKADEGDVRSIFCRKRGHFNLGRRGGAKVLSLSEGTKDVQRRYYGIYGGSK